MSTGQYRALGVIWRSLWPRGIVAPARITADRSVIRLEISKDFLQGLAPIEPAAAALLQAFAATNHGDWGGPEYPEVFVEPDHLRPLLRRLAVLMLPGSEEHGPPDPGLSTQS